MTSYVLIFAISQKLNLPEVKADTSKRFGVLVHLVILYGAVYCIKMG